MKYPDGDIGPEHDIESVVSEFVAIHRGGYDAPGFDACVSTVLEEIKPARALLNWYIDLREQELRSLRKKNYELAHDNLRLQTLAYANRGADANKTT